MSFVILSIVCDKVTEEWGEIFEQLEKEGGPCGNNAECQRCFRSILIGIC